MISSGFLSYVMYFCFSSSYSETDYSSDVFQTEISKNLLFHYRIATRDKWANDNLIFSFLKIVHFGLKGSDSGV
jgi:hypothetical protein